jgi:serine/threonine-protein kinase HSL1 (negative regulator of Swe1 kinase)
MENQIFTDSLGTKGYMAPEILKYKRYNGFQVDIFALGVVLFSLITCKPPFEDASEYD